MTTLQIGDRVRVTVCPCDTCTDTAAGVIVREGDLPGQFWVHLDALGEESLFARRDLAFVAAAQPRGCYARAHRQYKEALAHLRTTAGLVESDLRPDLSDPDLIDTVAHAITLLGNAQQHLRETDLAVRKHIDSGDCRLTAPVAIETTCASCGDQCAVPGDEDPSDTLFAACADDEQNQ